MLASTHFKIKRVAADDWFDPILNADTQLFIDPFLVFKDKKPSWSKGHEEIIGHFDLAFRLIAEGNLKSGSLAYRKAVDILVFKEPKELCLGYTSKGTEGLGGGRGYARQIAEAIATAIQRGVKHPRHFEELGILNEGFWSDRISDATATILKPRLIEYTQAIAARHGIPLTSHRIYAGSFDADRQRFEVPMVDLPTNPFGSGPLLFVPERFLRDLPVLNADDWWTFYENERLREDLNYEILRKVNKATIVATARANPEVVRKWAIAKEQQSVKGYDLVQDPNGVWQWDAATGAFASENPLSVPLPKSSGDFTKSIDLIISQFKLFVEDQGGWELLWERAGVKEKPEHAVQLLFRGIAQHYCKANNIVLDAEVNLGRGPVDFKFSNGYHRRAHLEVKKLHNGKFWNGFELQLPSYMKSDEVSDGWFLAVQYRSGKAADARIMAIPKRVAKIAESKGINLRQETVDARPKKSASKL